MFIEADSDERPGKKLSPRKSQIEDLAQVWNQVREELPKSARSTKNVSQWAKMRKSLLII